MGISVNWKCEDLELLKINRKLSIFIVLTTGHSPSADKDQVLIIESSGTATGLRGSQGQLWTLKLLGTESKTFGDSTGSETMMGVFFFFFYHFLIPVKSGNNNQLQLYLGLMCLA